MALLPDNFLGNAVNFSGSMQKAYYITIIIMALLLVGALGFFLYQQYKYRKITVMIYSERSNKGLSWFQDKAAILKRDKYDVLRLQKSKVSLQVPPQWHYVPGVKSVLISLRKLSNDEFVSCPIILDNHGLELMIPSDIRFWGALAWQKIEDTYARKTNLMQILAFGFAAFVIIAALIIIAMILNKFEVLTTLSGQLTVLVDKMTILADKLLAMNP